MPSPVTRQVALIHLRRGDVIQVGTRTLRRVTGPARLSHWAGGPDDWAVTVSRAVRSGTRMPPGVRRHPWCSDVLRGRPDALLTVVDSATALSTAASPRSF